MILNYNLFSFVSRDMSSGDLVTGTINRDIEYWCLFLKLTARLQNGCLFSRGAYIYGMLINASNFLVTCMKSLL